MDRDEEVVGCCVRDFVYKVPTSDCKCTSGTGSLHGLRPRCCEVY